MDTQQNRTHMTGRRQFLSRVSAAVTGSAMVLGSTGFGSQAQLSETAKSAPLLPTIKLGSYKVTRLVVGSNPISGYSYMGPILDRHMKEYFTPERIVEFLWNCEQAGINTHQFSRPEEMASVFRTLRQRGSKMNFICLHSGGQGKMSSEQVVRDTSPIGIAHHGGVTDRLFREGKSSEVHDFVKRVHDAGVLAGVSAHNPECIKRIADEGWEVDFFMTCFYYLTRTKQELEQMPPVATAEVSYAFFASDPTTMTEVARQVDQPCLGFKILAAGRRCAHERDVEEAFKFAFENLKASDGVIVGMYPRYQDQVTLNAGYARKYAVSKKG